MQTPTTPLATPYNKAKIAGTLAETGRIFASLQIAMNGINNPVIVISSATTQEGKSSIAASLGVVAARSCTGKTLIIDCNWHAPTLHTFFNLETKFNLEKSLANNNLHEQVMSTSYANLDILPAPIYQEKLETTKNAIEIIRQLRSDYAFTIIDTAAILSANRHMVDPIVLASEADGLALTILANRTSRQMVKKAQTMLDVSGTTILGLIINQYCNPMAV